MTWALLVLVGLLLVKIFLDRRHLVNDRKLSGRIIVRLQGEYRALEQGMDEQQENYEQDFLSFSESIENFKHLVASQLVEIAEAEAYLEKYQRETIPAEWETQWSALNNTKILEDIQPKKEGRS